MAEVKDEYQIINLNANKEVRFVINHPSEEISIELLDGSVEAFGVQMITNKIYTFSSSFALATWNGCTLKLPRERCFTIQNISRNNVIYNIHTALEEHRAKAEKRGTKGPITLIVGPTDVGKSTLTRSLLNHAASSGRKPLYVDLDVGQSSISIPGTLGILAIDSPENLNSGFNENNLSAYFFGHKSPGENIPLYFLLIKKLGETLNYRLKKSKSVSQSGAVIDTCGWIDGRGYQSILVAARSFQINLLIVLSDKNLHKKLEYDLPANVEIQYIPKLEGVVERNKFVRMSRRENLVREYFYGSLQSPLNPHTLHLEFSDIKVLQVIISNPKVSIDRLDLARDCISVVPVPITPQLQNSILAISYANDCEDVVLESVLGFICVKNVDMDHKILTVLSPQPSLLQKKLLIMGGIKFDPNQS